jgi:hypothetical protein
MRKYTLVLIILCSSLLFSAKQVNSPVFSKQEMIDIAMQYHTFHNVIVEIPDIKPEYDLRFLDLDEIKAGKNEIISIYDDMKARSSARIFALAEGCNIEFQAKDVSQFYSNGGLLTYIHCTSNSSMLYELCPDTFERILKNTYRSFRYAKDNGYYIFTRDGRMLDLVEQKPEYVLSELNTNILTPAQTIEEAENLVAVYLDIWKENHTLILDDDDLAKSQKNVKLPLKVTKEDHFHLRYCFVNEYDNVYILAFKIFKSGPVEQYISELKEFTTENKK